uniref:Uncharacterized protein n=1 Tax=Rhizophora mucronata TaxID=61149 RepID=A0A2P2NCV8_RHIMU
MSIKMIELANLSMSHLKLPFR